MITILKFMALSLVATLIVQIIFALLGWDPRGYDCGWWTSCVIWLAIYNGSFKGQIK